MSTTKNCSETATQIFKNLEIGGRVESSKSIGYLRRQQAAFNMYHPERHIVVMKSKLRDGVTIIMRAE